MLKDIDNSLKESEQSSLTQSLLITFGLAIFVALLVFFSIRLLLSALISLRNAVEDLANGEGDLTTILPRSSLDILDDISCHFNRFLKSMSGDINSLKSACEQLNEVATVSRRQHNDLALASSKQVQETGNTATAIEKMSTTAMEIADNAERTRVSVESTDSEVQNVLKQVKLSGEELNALNGVLTSVKSLSKNWVGTLKR